MTYRTEFPDFAPETMPAIPAGWTDQSWHNDACPSFDTGNKLVVFIDFANPEDREFPETPRFVVIHNPEFSDDQNPVLATDDFSAVLALVAKVEA